VELVELVLVIVVELREQIVLLMDGVWMVVLEVLH
jgi:hypothetical protein